MTIGGSIVASIILHIFFAPHLIKNDQRDREIGRFGEVAAYRRGMPRW